MWYFLEYACVLQHAEKVSLKSYKMERGEVEGLIQDGRALVEYHSTDIKIYIRKARGCNCRYYIQQRNFHLRHLVNFLWENADLMVVLGS